MRRSEDSRRAESARAYVAAARAHSALRTTVTLAAELLGYPIGQVNILDADTQHTLASVGPHEYGTVARSRAMCDAVVAGGVPVVVPDLADGPPPPVEDVGCYVGVPLEGREGVTVGSLCLMDTRPRRITPTDVERLQQFALVVQEQLDLLRRTGAATTDGAAATRDLAAAIDRGDVRPWFQPVVDLATGAVIGYEALARWHHPELGVLAPSSFVPHAEDSDLIVDLDLAVFGAALDEARRWWVVDPGLRLGVNVSGYHLANPRSLARYEAEVARVEVPAGRVTLEVTETAALPPGGGSRAAVERLRATGFLVVLDDFGTSWSSLEQILAFPVDGLKIDRTMAAALGSREGDAVVRCVAGLAAELGLGTVIEGIETRTQASRARQLGCRSGQGYLWSEPVPAEALPALGLRR